jgi:hypothetical protein
MKIGQPKPSEWKIQRSGLFVTPTKRGDKLTPSTDDLR